MIQLSDVFLVVLCTTWHSEVNGSRFHAKEKIVNHNLIFKDFIVKFLVE